MTSASSDDAPGSAPGRVTDAGLLALVLIWGVNFSVIKVGLRELHPLAFNALRFPLAVLALAGLLAIRGSLSLPRREDVPRIGSTRTSVFSNLVPVVALAVAWVWLGETPTGLQLAGAAVVIGGMTLTRTARADDPAAAPADT